MKLSKLLSPISIGKVQLKNRIAMARAWRLCDPEVACKAIETGKIDIVSLGRQSLADPYWPKKVMEGRIEDIRPCLGCHDGCMDRPKTRRRSLTCSVNPLAGREDSPILPAARKKKFMIIGGGVAGMEAR